MPDEKGKELTDYILKMATKIFEIIGPVLPQEWLSSDVTVTQLRVLLILQTTGSARMSDIAAGIGVALPTATGVVDNLVTKGMVTRETSPSDRRVVVCKLSPRGKELTGKLWEFGRLQLVRMLDGLDIEQLNKAAEVADILYSNIAGSSKSGVDKLETNKTND